MESRFAKAWGAGCARQALLSVAIMAVVFGIAGCAVVLALFAPLPASLENSRDLLVGITLAVALGGVLAAAIAAAFVVIRRRAARLDAAFEGTGLRAASYFFNGRQYHGERLGRPIDAYFYRGPVLDLYVGADLRTRASVALKDKLTTSLANLVDRNPFPIDDPAFQNIEVYAPDPAWTRDLLSRPEVRAAVARLVQSSQPYEVPQLLFQPEAILLRRAYINHNNIDQTAILRWLNDLTWLAREAESVPRTKIPVEATRLEQLSHTRRNAYLLPAVGIVFALIIIPLAILFLVVFLILFARGAL